MDEPVVFDHVVDEPAARSYEPLVHVPAAHEGAMDEYDPDEKPRIVA